MKSLAYETRAMLRALDRYWDKCSEIGPVGNYFDLHDDEAYWALFEKRRERVESLIDKEKGGE